MEFTGVGLYTLPYAQRLIGVKSRDISRWLFGYSYRIRKGEESRFSAPLWTPQFAQLDTPAIGFHDLLEVRFLAAFASHGVHLSVIRTALRNARQLFGTPYPLTAERFLTDGRRIFHEAAKAGPEPELTDLASLQTVFSSIMRPSLYAGIEYTQEGLARRWYPVSRSKAIVIDPKLSFGKPVLADYGIPVEAIAAAMRAEQSPAKVARLFNISQSAALAAGKYGQRLAA